MDQEEELDAINSFDEDLYRLEEETNELQKMLPNVDSEATPFQVLETAKATIEQWEHEIQVADQNGEPKKVEELTAAKNKIEENVSSISSEFDKELQKLNPVVDYTVYCDDDFVPSVGDDDTATDDTEADDTATDDTATDDTATDDTATDDTATDDTEADDTDR